MKTFQIAPRGSIKSCLFAEGERKNLVSVKILIKSGDHVQYPHQNEQIENVCTKNSLVKDDRWLAVTPFYFLVVISNALFRCQLSSLQ